jgi:hypothetical protein
VPLSCKQNDALYHMEPSDFPYSYYLSDDWSKRWVCLTSNGHNSVKCRSIVMKFPTLLKHTSGSLLVKEFRKSVVMQKSYSRHKLGNQFKNQVASHSHTETHSLRGVRLPICIFALYLGRPYAHLAGNTTWWASSKFIIVCSGTSSHFKCFVSDHHWIITQLSPDRHTVEQNTNSVMGVFYQSTIRQRHSEPPASRMRRKLEDSDEVNVLFNAQVYSPGTFHDVMKMRPHLTALRKNWTSSRDLQTHSKKWKESRRRKTNANWNIRVERSGLNAA